MQVPSGQTMYVGKSDLSNFYHHLGLPTWMQPYFALPELTQEELAACGLPLTASFPMCLTLPMGFSHAVYLAQCAHTHVLYSHCALHPRDSLLLLSSPNVSRERVVHGIVIDDLFLFSLSLPLAQRVFDAVLAAYRSAGFVVKESKVVRPTPVPVKVIGFDIDGTSSSISLPADSQLSLMRATHAALHAGTVSGTVLSHLLGRWTWVMLLAFDLRLLDTTLQAACSGTALACACPTALHFARASSPSATTPSPAHTSAATKLSPPSRSDSTGVDSRLTLIATSPPAMRASATSRVSLSLIHI